MQRLSFPDEQSMHEAAAGLIAETAGACIRERGRFSIALSGGNTPQKTHALLRGREYMNAADWAHVFVFWGDDRMVPFDSEHSNFKMAAETLLDHIPIPEKNVFPIPYDLIPEQAERRYSAMITDVLGEDPVMDLCFQGLGPDGHTASLFPGSPILDESVKLIAYEPSPGLPPKVPRLTMTLPMINRARKVLFLVTGEAKKGIVDELFSEPDEAFRRYPAARIRPRGEVVWFTV